MCKNWKKQARLNEVRFSTPAEACLIIKSFFWKICFAYHPDNVLPPIYYYLMQKFKFQYNNNGNK